MRVRTRGSKEQGQKEVAANIKGDSDRTSPRTGIMTTTTASAKVKDTGKKHARARAKANSRMGAKQNKTKLCHQKGNFKVQAVKTAVGVRRNDWV